MKFASKLDLDLGLFLVEDQLDAEERGVNFEDPEVYKDYVYRKNEAKKTKKAVEFLKKAKNE